MMVQTALITGGGTGIGKSLAIELANRGLDVFVIGRRVRMLKETQSHMPDKIHPIQADISTSSGRNDIYKVLRNQTLNYLINNAAVVEPLKTIDAVTLSEFHDHLAINLEGPFFLAQSLLPVLEKGSARILNISTGLAHRALAGMGLYSISKSGLHMLYKIWNKEWHARSILAPSVPPLFSLSEFCVSLTLAQRGYKNA